MRKLASHPAARDLADDAAVLEIGGTRLVLTHDMLVEDVHFLTTDTPADIAWKLVAVNLSDLAAKGARPIGALLGYSLSEDGWDSEFATGLEKAVARFGVALLGGDTVAMPKGSPRVLALTAIGRADVMPPSRAGAKAGDTLWVSGTIGDAGAGLRIAQGENGPEALALRYRRPEPRLAAGEALAPLVSAMMDVSDGLLIDAGRLAEASGVAIAIDLDLVPLLPEHAAHRGADREARIAAATAGDDYELLFSAPPERSDAIAALSARLGLALTPIGRIADGGGLTLSEGDAPIALPERLGYLHRRSPKSADTKA